MYYLSKYISINSRNGAWGKGAIDTISKRLDKELPGFRGFTSRNLRYMRTFYEEWKILDPAGSSLQTENDALDSLEFTNSKIKETTAMPIWNLQVPNYQEIQNILFGTTAGIFKYP